MSAEKASRSKMGWDNPVTRERRITSLKESWADPEKREYRISRCHSPEAESKRSASLKIWVAENPLEAKERTKAAHEALKIKAEKEAKNRLGENPEETLSAATAEFLSTREIAKKFGISVFTTQNYLNKYGAKIIRVTHLSIEEAERRKGLFYWADIFGLVQNLPNRYPEIMTSLYGMGREKIALETVAQEFGLTRERIRQIDKRSREILERSIDSMVG